MILRESAGVVRSRPPLVIAETRHGFVCASAGVDASNAPAAGHGRAAAARSRTPPRRACALGSRELTGVEVGRDRQRLVRAGRGVRARPTSRSASRGSRRSATSGVRATRWLRAPLDDDRCRRRDRGRRRARDGQERRECRRRSSAASTPPATGSAARSRDAPGARSLLSAITGTGARLQACRSSPSGERRRRRRTRLGSAVAEAVRGRRLRTGRRSRRGGLRPQHVRHRRSRRRSAAPREAPIRLRSTSSTRYRTTCSARAIRTSFGRSRTSSSSMSPDRVSGSRRWSAAPTRSRTTRPRCSSGWRRSRNRSS